MAHFPKAEFASSSIVPSGTACSYNVSGVFTLHGVQKPVTFPAKIAVNGDEVTFNATITLRQTDFGMVEAAKKTKDDVPVTVSIHGRRK